MWETKIIVEKDPHFNFLQLTLDWQAKFLTTKFRGALKDVRIIVFLGPV